MNPADVKERRIQILQRIDDKSVVDPIPELTGILKTILEYSVEEACYAMGDFGGKLRMFASQINTICPHPDLFKLFDGELTSNKEGSFNRDASDMLKLAAYGKAWNMSQNVLENLKRVITKSASYASISMAIDDPEENLLHVRFIPDQDKRDTIRSRKKMQAVNTNLIYKRGMQFWTSEPNNLLTYSRNYNQYQVDIEEASKRLQHFSNLGLSMMSGEIKKSLDVLKKLAEDSQYFGFNKISLTSAAVILAKESDFIYIAASSMNGLFDDLIIHSDHEAEFEHNMNMGLMSNSDFTPRVYGYHEIASYASEETIQVMKYLESFPDADGHALFDHYKVLVPGLEVDALQQGKVVAALLGERDGSCYFINYF